MSDKQPVVFERYVIDGEKMRVENPPSSELPAPSGSASALPAVAGRRLRGSNEDFEHACLVHIERLQNGLGDYDSAMLDTFCEAVRLCREYSDAMAIPNSDSATG